MSSSVSSNYIYYPNPAGWGRKLTSPDNVVSTCFQNKTKQMNRQQSSVWDYTNAGYFLKLYKDDREDSKSHIGFVRLLQQRECIDL